MTRLPPLATLLALMAGLDIAPTAAQEYSLDDWMTVTAVGSFLWSPDGGTIYYTSDAAPSGTDGVFSVSVGGGEPTLLSVSPEGVRPEPVQGLTLSADGSTLFFTQARYFQAYTNIHRMPASGGPAEALTFNDAIIQTSPAPSPDGRTLAYFSRTGRGTKIELMDLQRPSWSRLLLPDDGQERSPSWSVDGKLAFARGGDIWVMDVVDARPRRVIEDAHAGGNAGAVWSPDGTRIAFITGRSGYAQVGVVDVATGVVTPVTYQAAEHADVSWSPDGAWLAFVRNDPGGMSRDLIVARSDGSGSARVLTDGKGWRSSPSFSPDGRQVGYLESTSVRTTDIWTVPVEGGASRQLTRSMGRIDPARLRPAEEISYRGADNLRIPGMLWLPRDFDPSRLHPVLVRLHGHPGQWNHGFRMMTQYFVSRGFVAVAPNPRGSRGFGAGFHDLHVADYGGAEFDDVMRVVPFLDSLGYVDMGRKATWGGSGGGYMSLVIATEAPRAFEAQVIRAPVSSWNLLAVDRFGASGRAWTATRTPARERSEFGGPPEEIPAEYHRRSPLNFVEAVEVPQLLFQGLRDGSVPPRQSQVWAHRMRELGKDSLIDYVEYPDEDHGLTRYRSTIRDRIERMERFLARHLDLPALAGGG